MVRVCCVDGCAVSKKPGVELKYFKFPKSRSLKAAWLKVAKRDVKWTPNSLVCSRHFAEGDYITANGRLTLKKSSVPWLALGETESKSPEKVLQPSETNHEYSEESDSQESTSGKEDNTITTHETESHPNCDTSSTRELLSSVSRLGTEEKNGSGGTCDDVETGGVSGDSSEVIQTDSVMSCEKVTKDSGVSESQNCDRSNKLDGAAIENCERCSLLPAEETNGCDPPVDPLSCPNGELDPVCSPARIPPTPEGDGPPKGTEAQGTEDKAGDTVSSEAVASCAASSASPAMVEGSALDSNEPDRSSTDNELSVLDPKTGLMRKGRQDSIESIADSCESLGESTEEGLRLAEPVFVEISVDPSNIGSPSPPDSPTDCMMIVENVQVDVDPSLLLDQMDHDTDQGDQTDHGERPDRATPADQADTDDDVQMLETKPVEPVSLLTSSDESDVILQEPHIDCVSVSDETSEDDRPLTRLLRDARRKKAQVKKVTDILERRFNDIFWGKTNELYCYMCAFTTNSRAALAAHAARHAAHAAHAAHATRRATRDADTHRRVRRADMSFYVCNVCDFQTPTKTQFVRHKRKHRDDKKFHCSLCDYRARHKMSLLYHVKSTHLDSIDLEQTDDEAAATSRERDRSGGGKTKTKGKKRASRRSRTDDDDYVPGADV